MIQKPRLVTGIKPTGTIHLGNYFGTMRQLLGFQDTYESFIFIADLHALNQVQDAKLLSSQSMDIAKAYLAVGLDPKKVTLFRQSDVREHSELCWILNTVTSMSSLELAHAYKDALANGKPANVGLFDYPVLMTADILLYDAAIVPVGNDQRQHIEIAREIARAYNRIFGQAFIEPKEMIQDDVATVPGTDGRKMSKSYNNIIPLFGSPEETKKAVMSIVTDSKGASDPKDPDSCNVFALHKLFTTDIEALGERYRAGTISYKESKELLAENINATLAPVREKKTELDNNPSFVEEVLRLGKERATELAHAKMQKVRNLCGFADYSF